MTIWKKDCHLKKDTAMCDRFEIDCIEKHPYMHTLILFTRSRFFGNVKIFFLKIEYLESLLELVLRKICGTVFS